MGKLLLPFLVGSAVTGLASGAALERRAPAIALAQHTHQLTRQFSDTPAGGRMRPWHQRLNAARQFAPVQEEAADAEADPVAVGVGFVRAEQNQVEYVTDVKAGNQTFQL